MLQPSIRVAVGGGHPIDRAGLAALLASFPGIEVVPIDSADPPAVLVWDAGLDDSRMPDSATGMYVLVLVDIGQNLPFTSNAAGFFSKDDSPQELGAAVRQVARGQQYLSPSLAISILQQQAQSQSPSSVDLTDLSKRECEILGLLAQGLNNKAIAARLYLSVRTVEGHLDKLYARLGVHSRTEAVIFAMRHFENR